MKNKTVNLSVWMFLKVVPAVLLLLYYWMCTVEGYNPVFRYIHAVTLVVAALACVFADFSGMIAGYFVAGGILLLTIIRATMFAVIDRKEM